MSSSERDRAQRDNPRFGHSPGKVGAENSHLGGGAPSALHVPLKLADVRGALYAISPGDQDRPSGKG